MANVATLPGIQIASLAMPDIHWGYGFCIGGVCATDPDEGGVISPGGVGYDINCGVRLVKTNLFLDDVKHAHPRAGRRRCSTPSRPASGGRASTSSTPRRRAGSWARGRSSSSAAASASPQDLDHTEAHGRIDGADPDEVTDHAVKRGAEQCGTLGSGNHFLEVQVVDQRLRRRRGEGVRAGAEPGLRDDPLRLAAASATRCATTPWPRSATARRSTASTLPDRQLACARSISPEGRKYIGAMRAAANFGFCNRQLLMHQAREVFADVFGRSWEDLGMELLYDVAHNIAKLEEHTVDGKKKKVWVHRKGATRAFPAGHPEVPAAFRAVGQPVIIPGDMGRASLGAGRRSRAAWSGRSARPATGPAGR